MSDNPQVIELIGGEKGQSIHEEKLSAAGSAIKPGYLIEELAAGTVQEHSTQAGNSQRLVALANTSVGGLITDTYAVGERVRFGAFQSGQKAYLKVAVGTAAILQGASLQSVGDGTVETLAVAAATTQAQRESVIGTALEAIDNSAGSAELFIKVRMA